MAYGCDSLKSWGVGHREVDSWAKKEDGSVQCKILPFSLVHCHKTSTTHKCFEQNSVSIPVSAEALLDS